jgi:hypothetical protein
MSLDLISDMIGQNSLLYFMYKSRLDEYIEQQKAELNGISHFRDDNPLVADILRAFVTNRLSPLPYLVSNEVYFDLVSGFKTNDCRFKGRNDIQKIIVLTYVKYAQFIRIKVALFYKNLSKLQTGFKKAKWKITKIRRIPQPIEPMKITLGIRFVIIKRANGKCEECHSSIFENPIDVFQITSEGKIKFIAYCNNCKKANEDKIIEEPEDELADD